MKKLLLTFSLAAMLLSAKAQIIITGVMPDPNGGDAAASPSTAKAYEYLQLKATQNIDFSVNNYAVVALYFGGSSLSTVDGWAGGGALAYQFNLTSGTVSKGEFFYVGGDGKTINGSGSTDISSAKWIKSVDYGKVVSDGPNAQSRTGLFVNSNTANGIAVFNTTNVTGSTIPIDVVFWGNPNAGHYQVGPPEAGFRICNNDLYSTANGEFYNKGLNTAVVLSNLYAAQRFFKFGGDYNTVTNTWDTPRSGSFILLNSTSTLADIETGTGVTTLPVSLTSFTAKANKIGNVDLAWTTASEQNNSHFEVNRSTDGANFNTVDKVNGNGTTATVNNYSYTDNSPAAGVNYYQLKQIDFDGKSTLSKVVSAKVGLNQSNIKVLANKTSITVNYQALANGKASFTVYSVSGAKLATVQQNVNVGANQLSIPVQLGNSLHLLKVVQGSESVSVKF